MSARFDPSLIPPSPDLALETSLHVAGTSLIAGLDEAGRGAWAGPVTAAAVILPVDFYENNRLAGVRDSKQLTPAQRFALEPIIKSIAQAWAVGFASSQEIDSLGILAATRLAMMRALSGLIISPLHLLIDALFLPEITIPQTALIKGDQRSLSIAAASILAKTARDRWMEDLALQEPAYGFEHHKGYGTHRHQSALSIHGPCLFHRYSFAPVKETLKENRAK